MSAATISSSAALRLRLRCSAAASKHPPRASVLPPPHSSRIFGTRAEVETEAGVGKGRSCKLRTGGERINKREKGAGDGGCGFVLPVVPSSSPPSAAGGSKSRGNSGDRSDRLPPSPRNYPPPPSTEKVTTAAESENFLSKY